MKLYKVETEKFTAYVVADNVLNAQKEFEQWLESKNYGYFGDREVLRIQVLADTNSKPNVSLYSTELLLGMTKAKVKETGEYVTVNPCYDGFYDVDTRDIYVPDDLDFVTEFNWQSFRRDVAKDILSAMINRRRTNEAGANILISK